MREKTQRWLRFLAKPFSISFLQKFSKTDRISVLYHHVGDEFHPLISPLYPFVNFQTFENQLDELSKHFNFLSADEWLTEPNKKGVLLTFDDGLTCCTKIAELLLKKGIPAVFFINPPFIRGENWMFRYKIAWILSNLKLTNEEKIQLLTVYEERKLVYQVPQNIENLYLTEEQLKRISAHGFEIGAHSQSHQLFEKLSVKEQKFEFSKSIQETEQLSGKPCRMFAFPFTDVGIKQDFFQWKQIHYPDIHTFGTAGAKNSPIKNHFQRIPMEKNLSCLDILKTELLGALLKK